jgi:hypothetical protein
VSTPFPPHATRGIPRLSPGQKVLLNSTDF